MSLYVPAVFELVIVEFLTSILLILASPITRAANAPLCIPVDVALFWIFMLSSVRFWTVPPSIMPNKPVYCSVVFVMVKLLIV